MAEKKKRSVITTLLKLGAALVLVIAVVVFGGAAWLPGEFSYAQSTTIKAGRGDVHAQVGELRRWNDWSPWTGEDPDMKTAYSEKTNEVGSWQEWTGPKIGKVKMQFTKVSEQEGIEYRFWFDGDDSGIGGVRYEDAEGGTRVTWWWKGPAGYPTDRWVHTIFGSKINESFAKGMANLKDKVEAKP